MNNFPIIDHRALGPARPGRLFRPAFRELSDLPPQPPGSVLVVEIDGHHEQLPGRSKLRGSEPQLVNASSVLVVDNVPGRLLVAELELPSKVQGEAFGVRATFRCSVLDSVLAARESPPDVLPSLVSYLRGDSKLVMLGRKYSLDQEKAFAVAVRARITAICRARPPRVGGLDIVLGDVEVVTPEDVTEHAKKMRAAAFRREEELMYERIRQEVATFSEDYNFERAEKLEKVLARGPEALEALWLRLGEARYGDATGRSYARQADKLTRLQEMIGTFAGRGQFDNVALDTQRLVNDFVNELLGSDAEGSRRSSYVLDDGQPDTDRSSLDSGDGEDADDDDGAGRPDDPLEEEVLD